MKNVFYMSVLAAFTVAFATTGAVADETENNILDDISTSFTAETYLDGFWDSPAGTADNNVALWWNRVSGMADLALTDQWSAQFGGYVSFTAPNRLDGPPTYPGEETSSARHADITALNLRFDGGDYDVVLGKAGVNIGFADIYSPIDVFEPININNPLHTFDMGVWQATLNYYLDQDTASFSILPFDERTRLPDSNSRWLGDSGDPLLFGLPFLPPVIPVPVIISDDFQSKTPDNWGYLATYTGIREGFDFLVGGYYGPGAYPVIRATLAPGPSIAVFKERPIIAAAFAGVTMVRGDWKTYAEAFLQYDIHGDDDDFIKLLVGATYDATEIAREMGLEDGSITVEYTHDFTLDTFTFTLADLIATGTGRLSSGIARPYQNSILSEVRLGVTNDIDVTAESAVNLDGIDYAAAFGVDYRYSDSLSFFGQITIFGGPTNTQFGQWRSNDNAFVGAEYRF